MGLLSRCGGERSEEVAAQVQDQGTELGRSESYSKGSLSLSVVGEEGGSAREGRKGGAESERAATIRELQGLAGDSVYAYLQFQAFFPDGFVLALVTVAFQSLCLFTFFRESVVCGLGYGGALLQGDSCSVVSGGFLKGTVTANGNSTSVAFTISETVR
jgi:hypothetical protein